MSEIGRNDPCPCGSGKKYKKCCGSKAGSTSKKIEATQLPTNNLGLFQKVKEAGDLFQAQKEEVKKKQEEKKKSEPSQSEEDNS